MSSGNTVGLRTESGGMKSAALTRVAGGEMFSDEDGFVAADRGDVLTGLPPERMMTSSVVITLSLPVSVSVPLPLSLYGVNLQLSICVLLYLSMSLSLFRFVCVCASLFLYLALLLSVSLSLVCHSLSYLMAANVSN